MYHILLLEYFGFRQVVKITTSLVGGGGGKGNKDTPDLSPRSTTATPSFLRKSTRRLTRANRECEGDLKPLSITPSRRKYSVSLPNPKGIIRKSAMEFKWSLHFNLFSKKGSRKKLEFLVRGVQAKPLFGHFHFQQCTGRSVLHVIDFRLMEKGFHLTCQTGLSLMCLSNTLLSPVWRSLIIDSLMTSEMIPGP